ncbi:hypothetical protein BB561_004853 [Smittium simulii]|uniref:Trehalase n=1 Tax=Smittium simulii TaxID=133385 RepID=A0A2T9YDX3_9FUNG|nr:hypothetical protein BB561_004853 [Smittium simulii]
MNEEDQGDKYSDIFAPPKQYYSRDYRRPSLLHSTNNGITNNKETPTTLKRLGRRNTVTSADAGDTQILINIEHVEKELLSQEDTDGDCQITILDGGPKLIRVPTLKSLGHRKIEIKGNYMISNLLQEIGLAKIQGRKYIVIDTDRLNENPVDRLLRFIKTIFWDEITRKMDEHGLEKICNDPKNIEDSKSSGMRIYIPIDDDDAFTYYTEMSKKRPDFSLKVIKLPKDISPEYVKSINKKSGILSLAACIGPEGSGPNGIGKSYDPYPFVVPGGRFNEMYGWDSYFIVLGLLADQRYILSKGMVNHFVYQIKHYGRILNANRTYYLTRSQPPFLTDMALQIFSHLVPSEENIQWLKDAFSAAIIEYYTVWLSVPRLDTNTGLSAYHPTGIGVPPETESSHYDYVLKPYADKAQLPLDKFIEKYNSGEISEPVLDLYFLHDRAVRESGHDTTYRFDNKCADLLNVDLNSLLHKYEIDIAETIDSVFGGKLEMPDKTVELAETWKNRAALRRNRMEKYMWNPEKKLYYDYNIKTQEQETYDSATSIYTLWARCATDEIAKQFIPKFIEKFKCLGGVVSGTKESLGEVSLNSPNRQWDYPYGWAPHQMIAWQGLENYNRRDLACDLAYRWLYGTMCSYVDYNGVIAEKFDVVHLTHKIDVEYGNVGTDFKLVSTEGFGWMNSSIEVGLKLITPNMRRALASLTHPDSLPPRSRCTPLECNISND